MLLFLIEVDFRKCIYTHKTRTHELHTKIHTITFFQIKSNDYSLHNAG